MVSFEKKKREEREGNEKRICMQKAVATNLARVNVSKEKESI